MKIIGTNSARYKQWSSRHNNNNGAYYYAKEIEDIILPSLPNLNVVIITAGATLYRPWEIPDFSIIVCHDNASTLKSYGNYLNKKLLWICSRHDTADLLASRGEKVIFIPLSVDISYVAQYKRKNRTNNIAFVGNAWAFKKEYLDSLPKHITQLSNMERTELLKEMSKYKNIIAEGRCLIEAQILGAECKTPEYKDRSAIWRDVLDSKDVIPLWNSALEEHSRLYSDKCIIECLKAFNDLETNSNRRVGDIFMVTKERAEELLGNKLNLVEKL